MSDHKKPGQPPNGVDYRPAPNPNQRPRKPDNRRFMTAQECEEYRREMIRLGIIKPKGH